MVFSSYIITVKLDGIYDTPLPWVVLNRKWSCVVYIPRRCVWVELYSGIPLHRVHSLAIRIHTYVDLHVHGSTLGLSTDGSAWPLTWNAILEFLPSCSYRVEFQMRNSTVELHFPCISFLTFVQNTPCIIYCLYHAEAVSVSCWMHNCTRC